MWAGERHPWAVEQGSCLEAPCDCSTDWQELRNGWMLFLGYLLRAGCVFNSFSAVRAHIQSWSRDVGWTAIFPASTLRYQSEQGWFFIPMFNPIHAAWAFPQGQPPGNAGLGVYFSQNSQLRLSICSCSRSLGCEDVTQMYKVPVLPIP